VTNWIGPSRCCGGRSRLASASTQRAKVLNALRRIQEGTYGTCVDCRALIPEGRLEARPEASRCVKCQSKRDRRH